MPEFIVKAMSDLHSNVSFGGGGSGSDGGDGGGGGNISVKTKSNPSVKLSDKGLEVCGTLAVPGFKVDGCATIGKGRESFRGVGHSPSIASRVAHDAVFERNGRKGPR